MSSVVVNADQFEKKKRKHFQETLNIYVIFKCARTCCSKQSHHDGNCTTVVTILLELYCCRNCWNYTIAALLELYCCRNCWNYTVAVTVGTILLLQLLGTTLLPHCWNYAVVALLERYCCPFLKLYCYYIAGTILLPHCLN